MSIVGSIALSVKVNDTSTSNTTGTNRTVIEETYTQDVADGTGADQVNKQWSGNFSLTATSTTYDLTALTGERGTVTFAKVKALFVFNDTATDGAFLTVGNAAATQWAAPFGGATQTVKVGPDFPLALGSLKAQSTGAWTVDASNKSLKIDAGAATITGRLIILGV